MYTNWDEKALWIHPYKWVSVTALITYLQQLRRYVIFTPTKMSETHIPLLEEITGPVPCTKNRRFPNNAVYTNELSAWQNDLDLLDLAVNIMLNKNKLTREYPFFTTTGEVEIYILKKIHYIMNLIEDGRESMVLQENFENLYGIVWEASQTDEPSNSSGPSINPSNNTLDPSIGPSNNTPGPSIKKKQKFTDFFE